MFTAKIENSTGEVLTLTGIENQYQIVQIEGLNPVPSRTNMVDVAGMDGALFNSSSLSTREIVATIKINGDVEQNRQNLYRFFKTKDSCRFYFENTNLDVVIDGYVESFECDLFSKSETAQIAIICPWPYFRSTEEKTATSNKITKLFKFPFSINYDEPVVLSLLSMDVNVVLYNSSESTNGLNIEIYVNDNCNSIEIKNTTNGEDLKLSGTFLAGDKLFINTNKGSKSIRLLRDGAFSNALQYLVIGSNFVNIVPGENVFNILVDGVTSSTILYVMFNYYDIYRGV